MGQKKLLRFNQIKQFENVHEYPETMAGNWRAWFKNENPVVLELACGRGEYTVALAKLFPQKNFIGVDVKGNRMYLGAKQALKDQLPNAAFLRTQIEMIDRYFVKDEVDEIWITFPDPQPRMSKAKKRLTHPRFLRLYAQFLKPGAAINLKTDSPELFEFTKLVVELFGLNLLQESSDAYAGAAVAEELRIKTYYEALDIARSSRIHYLKFSLPAEFPDRDAELRTILEQQWHEQV